MEFNVKLHFLYKKEKNYNFVLLKLKMLFSKFFINYCDLLMIKLCHSRINSHSTNANLILSSFHHHNNLKLVNGCVCVCEMSSYSKKYFKS